MTLSFQLPSLIPFAFPGISNVHCFFTTAIMGNISIMAADEKDRPLVKGKKIQLMEQFSLNLWTEVYQVHKDTMVEAPDHYNLSQTPPESADGLYTTMTRTALTIRTADCQPILLTHVNAKFIAAIHCGWRGNALNFPGSAVKHLCTKYNVPPHEIMAVRGPSLGPEASQFINFYKEWPAEFAQWFTSERHVMNLWQLTKDQLLTAGLPASNIFSLDLCTYSLPNLFFSHRQNHTGRQAAVIWKES